MSNENLYLYILMRKDLPSMGAGRAAAQASHAANAFWKKYCHTKDAIDWSNQTPQGFGTAIVLGVNKFDIAEKLYDAGEQGFACDKVVDPDYVIPVSAEVYPYIDETMKGQFEQSQSDPSKYLFHREEMTCAYIFGDKEKLAPLLSGLPLYS